MRYAILFIIGYIGFLIYVNSGSSRCGLLCSEDFWLSRPDAQRVAEQITPKTNVNIRWRKHPRSPLGFAIETGNDEAIRVLIEAGAETETALDFAVRYASIPTTKLLIDLGANVEGESGKISPLEAAVRLNRRSHMRLLLQAGALPDRGCGAERGPFGPMGSLYAVTPLGVAIAENRLEMVKLLIEGGTSSLRICSVPAVFVASGLKHPAIARLLIEHGGDVNTANRKGETPLHRAAQSGTDRMISFLIENGANVDASDEDGVTPLHIATWSRTMPGEKIALLVQAGAPLEPVAGKRKETPLMTAASRGTVPAITALIAAGAEIEAVDRGGRTPFLRAARWGTRDVVEALVTNGADISAMVNGYSALHLAVGSEKDDVLSYLLTVMPDIDIRNDAGETPLYRAVENEPSSTVSILLDAGASVDIPNLKGKTVFHEAADSQWPETLALLLAHADEPGVRNPVGATPLHIAAHRWRDRNVAILLEAGASVGARDRCGKVPLDYVRPNKNLSASSPDATIEILEKAASGIDLSPDGTASPDYIWSEGRKLCKRKARPRPINPLQWQVR